MKTRPFIYIALITLGSLIFGFFDLPGEKQRQLIPFTPQEILNTKINLGLDLQGGSQLDYKIDLRKVPFSDQKSIIDGILGVINRRVNSLGVAEPNIYTSEVGEEKHLIVELAGIKDLEQAKTTVGKTIQLEFKEKREGPDDPEREKKIKAEAQALLNKIKENGDFKLLAQETVQGSPERIFFIESKDFAFEHELEGQMQQNVLSALIQLEPGQAVEALIDNAANYTVDASGQLVQGAKGYTIVKLTEKRQQERQIDTPQTHQVSHILIAFKGAERAAETITRTEEEARIRAEEVLKKLNEGEKFEDLAKAYSDDDSNKEKGGVLAEGVVKDKGTYVKEFEDAAFNLKAGELSTAVKSPFGFHIIRADQVIEAKSEKKLEPQYKFMGIYYSAAPDEWQETGLSGQHFVRADVQFNQLSQPYVSIIFNEEGSKLFERLTEKNIGKPLAIFVGGQLISAPNVNGKISGGQAQISGRFTRDEAKNLARDLNTGAIPAPIILVGQYTIGATLGLDTLVKSLWAGLIGFLLVAVFMIAYYRLPGLLATIALAIYSAILIFLLKVSMPITWALTIAIGIFIYLILHILKNRDSGAEKTIALLLACFILFFLSYILSTSVVLTLAGIAGVILSIGMAVDANILIFERIKEELRDNRELDVAIEVGFERAWNSIRDSNFSSLITSGILFYFGSSIIQGFAFNLAAGILVSMFTAITITKTLIRALIKTKLAEKLWLFGAPKKQERTIIPIIQNRKKIYLISGIVLLISLLGIPIFGLKAGLDFTGGTLMEFKFKDQVTNEQLKTALQKSAEAVSVAQTTTVIPETTTDSGPLTTSDSQPKLTSSQEKIDFAKAYIIPSSSGYIIKSQHIGAKTHDNLITELKKQLGEFEETRFSTVGPTVGVSMQYRAIFAVLLASLMIVLYIAFAFRRVPRHVGKWRFGLTAIVALLHDLSIMLGVYVYLGAFLGVEIDALFITALLTVMGFSVHDTIVVFDRVREKLRYQHRDETFEDIANQAVNETISRSINTSLSVVLTLLALVFFGSESIRYFILSLLIGIIAGTYSSIFVATPLLVDWQNWVRNRKK